MKQKLAKQTPKNTKAKKPNNAVEEDLPEAVLQQKQITNGKLGKSTKKQKVRETNIDGKSKKPKLLLKQKEEQEDEIESDDQEGQAENTGDTKDVEETTVLPANESTSNTQNADVHRVFVRNIKRGTSADQIKKYFETCGPVKSVKIVDNYTSNFAFVNFTKKEAVPQALKLHNKKLNGSAITVYENDSQRKLKKRNGKLTIKLNNKQHFESLESEKLEDIFSKCGEIENLLVLCKKNTLAFITFKTEGAVQNAFKLNGTTEQGIELEIAAYDMQKPKTAIYVMNIHPATTEEDLKTLFSQAGEVSDIALQKGRAVIAFKNSEGYCKSFMLNEVLLHKLPIFLEPYSIRKKNFIKHSLPFVMDKNQSAGDSVFSPKSLHNNKKRPAAATQPNVDSVPTAKKLKTKEKN